MTDLRKAAEMALGALDYEAREEPESIWIAEREALRQALDDKPPVKSYCGGKPNYCTPEDTVQVTTQVTTQVTPEVAKRKTLAELLDSTPVDAVNMSEERVDETAKGEQEPVAWYDKHGSITHDPFEGITPLYAAPPKREWVGLTDDEVSAILDREIGFNSCWGPETDFARAIESKLKEKNGG